MELYKCDSSNTIIDIYPHSVSETSVNKRKKATKDEKKKKNLSKNSRCHFLCVRK